MIDFMRNMPRALKSQKAPSLLIAVALEMCTGVALLVGQGAIASILAPLVVLFVGGW